MAGSGRLPWALVLFIIMGRLTIGLVLVNVDIHNEFETSHHGRGGGQMYQVSLQHSPVGLPWTNEEEVAVNMETGQSDKVRYRDGVSYCRTRTRAAARDTRAVWKEAQ